MQVTIPRLEYWRLTRLTRWHQVDSSKNEISDCQVEGSCGPEKETYLERENQTVVEKEELTRQFQKKINNDPGEDDKSEYKERDREPEPPPK